MPFHTADTTVFLQAVGESDPSTQLLQGRRAGGCSAAKSVRSGLQFLEKHLGFEFGCADASMHLAVNASFAVVTPKPTARLKPITPGARAAISRARNVG